MLLVRDPRENGIEGSLPFWTDLVLGVRMVMPATRASLVGPRVMDVKEQSAVTLEQRHAALGANKHEHEEEGMRSKNCCAHGGTARSKRPC